MLQSLTICDAVTQALLGGGLPALAPFSPFGSQQQAVSRGPNEGQAREALKFMFSPQGSIFRCVDDLSSSAGILFWEAVAWRCVVEFMAKLDYIHC